jgi:hypothetical protein
MSAVEPARIRVSVSELRRVLPDALRVMGISLGQADSVAEMAIWTATQSDGVIAFLRRRRAQMMWTPRPRAVISARSHASIEIDARGASLLELGSRIFDSVIACVDGGVLEARVHRTYGDIFLPYLVWRAARQGFAVEVVRQPGDDVDANGGRAGFRPDALVFTAEQDSPPKLEAMPARYMQAVHEGIGLTIEDFEFLMGQFEILRVPTSERSRSHAG